MSFVSWMLGAVGFCFSLISYILISQGYIVLDVLDRVLVKLELKLVGKYDCVPADGETVVSGHNTRASWQLRKDNVSVFAIQGRRIHMEDRFNVVTNMEHTGTSIYGIFDGHGGEVDTC
jgi:protein phosphatase 1L